MACDILSNLNGLFHFSNDVTDSSGNGNDLTNNGATFVNDKNSVANQAADFDGTNDFMDVPSALSPGNVDFTLSFWLNLDTATAGEHYYDFNSSSTPYLRLSESAGNLTMEGFDGTNNPVLNVTLPGTGSWKHVVMILDRANKKFEIFVDKVSQGSTTYTTFNDLGSSSNVRLGSRTTAANFYNGQMDEVRFYSRVLNQEEINTLFTGYDNPVCPSSALFFGGGL